MLFALFSAIQSTQQWRDAQSLKKISSYANSSDWYRLAASGQAQVVICGKSEISSHILKRTVLFQKLVVGVGRVGLAGETASSFCAGNPHKLLRIVKRQRPQQERIHHTEDRNIGPDS